MQQASSTHPREEQTTFIAAGPVKVELPSKEGALFCPPSENHMAGSSFRLEYREGYNVLELCFRRFNGSMDKSRQVPLDLETIGPWGQRSQKGCDNLLTKNLWPG